VLEMKDELVLFNKRLTSPNVVKAHLGAEWEAERCSTKDALSC